MILEKLFPGENIKLGSNILLTGMVLLMQQQLLIKMKNLSLLTDLLGSAQFKITIEIANTAAGTDDTVRHKSEEGKENHTRRCGEEIFGKRVTGNFRLDPKNQPPPG